MTKRATLLHSRDCHRAAVAACAEQLRRLDDAAWQASPEPGAWSPADVSQHLSLTFEAAIRDLRGEGSMQVRTALPVRLVLRFTVLPRLLRGGPFPRARAPRETRPVAAANLQRDAAIERLQLNAAEFEDLAVAAYDADRRRRLTHPYFGSMSLSDVLLISARHVEHHAVQLRSPRRSKACPQG